ncbi:MAG: patatin-like phospholipase family protein [Pseudomonadota bacterium]
MHRELTRRQFLALTAGATLAGLPPPPAGARHSDRSVGIALGGGGARGLAHVEILMALDELGVRPRLIAGTSMGAVVGALYASGYPAARIKVIVRDALARQGGSMGFFRKELLEWIHLVDSEMSREVLLTSNDFITFIHEQIHARTFAELDIPLLVVAADIQRREQVVLHEHDLLQALEASFAFPGLFNPVVRDERILVDGGVVNPVPFDLLRGHCDLIIAVDVSGRRTPAPRQTPGIFDVVAESFQTMERSILEAKMKDQPPDIYLKPDLLDIRLLDFGKAETIYTQARPARARLQAELQRLLA